MFNMNESEELNARQLLNAVGLGQEADNQNGSKKAGPKASPQPQSSTLAPKENSPLTLKQFGLSFVPLMPVPFTGDKAIFAYTRIAAYSALAYFTFSKQRKLSYLFIGAAGLSAMSSAAANTWRKQ